MSTKIKCEQMETNIRCSHCNHVFSARKCLFEHMRKFHPDEVPDMSLCQMCSICDKKLRGVTQLYAHIEKQHPDINLNFDKKTFYCVGDFEEWKKEMEVQTESFFIKVTSGKRLADERIAFYYFCHRSGERELKKNRIRRIKCSGSNKIGRLCPASIKVYQQTIGEAMEIEVQYQSVHLGHKTEVGRLPLDKCERLRLANQLNQGVPMSKILTDIESAYSPTKRESLTLRKDLHNIKRNFKPSTITCSNSSMRQGIEPYISIVDMNELELSKYEEMSSEIEQTVAIQTENRKSSVLSKLENLIMNCKSDRLSDEQLKIVEHGVDSIENKLSKMKNQEKKEKRIGLQKFVFQMLSH